MRYSAGKIYTHEISVHLTWRNRRLPSPTRINLEEPVRVASPTGINLEEPVRVASPTRINLEEPGRVTQHNQD